jgi:hypothetical protein
MTEWLNYRMSCVAMRSRVVYGEFMKLISLMPIAVMLTLLSGFAHSEIYKSVSADGEVVYSDKPSQGAERMPKRELSTYKPPELPARTSRRPARPARSDYYKDFSIIKPQNDATIRNNPGIIMVEVKLNPGLQNNLGHKVQFYLDDEPYGPPVDNYAVTLSNLDRGEHSLSASVINAKGEIQISTIDVDVHLKRESRLQNDQSTETDNPGNISENPNKLSNNPNRLSVNPNVRTLNPNVRTLNPNVLSNNPNVINPPKPPPPPRPAPLPSGGS